jgi:hypothetical protein
MAAPATSAQIAAVPCHGADRSRRFGDVRRALCLSVGVLLSASAPCRAEWTVAAFAGGVHTSSADLRVTDAARGLDVTFPDTTYDSESFDAPFYYGYQVGRSVYRRRLFIEGELIHAKVFARFGGGATGFGAIDGRPVSGIRPASLVQHVAMSHGLNLIFVNIAWRQPLSRRVAAVGRAGFGPVLAHAETEIAGERRADYQWAGNGLQAAGGVELRLWRAFQAIVEYKFTRARPRIDTAAGGAELTTRSHHVAAGVSWTSRGR